MRVDTVAGEGPFGDLDTLSRLKGYLSALRRRWYVLVVPLVVGAALGWFLSPGESAVPLAGGPQYYRAAHVLIDEAEGTGPNGEQLGPTVGLAQAAYLVNTGEVPSRVAAELGVPVDEVTSSVIGLPRTQVASVEVQAVGTDRDEVVRLADAAAVSLLDQLKADATATSEQDRDRILGRLGELETEMASINGQIALGAPDRTQLESQLRSLNNQYSLTYEEFSQLASRPEPSAGLVSLEGAKSVQIPESVYDRTKETIRDGADYVTGEAPTTEPENGSLDEPGPGASRTTKAGLGGLMGLAVGLGLVLLLDRFDSRLRRGSEVQAATGLTVLAEVPPLRRHSQKTFEVVAHSQHRSRAAEAYRVIRGSVLFALPTGREDGVGSDDGATVLMVTSPNPAEGKTNTVANLAAVFAEGGFSVLVINCDFRRPQVHKYLAPERGIADVSLPGGAEGQTRVDQVVVSATNVEGVMLVTGLGEGDPDANPLDVVAMQRKVIRASRSRFDVILLDTAPFLTTNDASELLSETDQVLLVVRAGRTKVEAAHRAATVLARFEAPVLGVIMNDSDDSPAAEYYYAYATARPSRRRRGGGGGGSEGAPAAEAATEVNGKRPASDSVSRT